jgi:hypothetical protein
MLIGMILNGDIVENSSRELSLDEIEAVSGGMIWQGAEQSMNVIDCRSGWVCYDSYGNVDMQQTSLGVGYTFPCMEISRYL